MSATAQSPLQANRPKAKLFGNNSNNKKKISPIRNNNEQPTGADDNKMVEYQSLYSVTSPSRAGNTKKTASRNQVNQLYFNYNTYDYGQQNAGPAAFPQSSSTG